MDVTRKELEEWYNSMTVDELREKLGYSSARSVYSLLRKAGIALKSTEQFRKRHSIQIVDRA